MTKQQIIDVINFAFEKYPFSKYKIPVSIVYERGDFIIKSINDIKFTDFAVIFDYYLEEEDRYRGKCRSHHFGYVTYDRIISIEMDDSRYHSETKYTIIPQKI